MGDLVRKKERRRRRSSFLLACFALKGISVCTYVVRFHAHMHTQRFPKFANLLFAGGFVKSTRTFFFFLGVYMHVRGFFWVVGIVSKKVFFFPSIFRTPSYLLFAKEFRIFSQFVPSAVESQLLSGGL